MYPRQNEGRRSAVSAWRGSIPDALANVIIAEVEKRVSLGWRNEMPYVPSVRTFLDERRWQQPYTPPRPQQSQQPEGNGLGGRSCMRIGPECHEVLEGIYRNGWQTFPPCPACESRKVGASWRG